ncbi:MAG: glycosyltransferase family 39 protein [Terriglobales bacterium]
MSSTDIHFRTAPDTREAPSLLRPRRFPVTAVLLLLLVGAAFLVRLWPVRQVHFWDEAVYLQNAEVICCAKTNYSELDSRPPLLSLLFAIAFRIWHSAYAAGILTAALNSLGPLFLYLAGRRVVGKCGAAIAAMLLTFLPFFISGATGNSLLTDSPALTLVLVCFWMLLKSEDSETWFAGAGFAGAMAVLMRFASLPTIAVLSLLTLRGTRRIAAVLRFSIGLAAGLLPYLLWSRIRYGGFLTTLRHGWGNVAGSIEPASFYVQNFAQVFSWVAVAGLVLWLAISIFRRVNSSVYDRVFGADAQPSRRGWAMFLWFWTLIVLAYFSAIPHKELRYILPLAPPLLLLTGSGLAHLVRFQRLPAKVAGVVVLVLALGFTFAPDMGRFRDPLVSPFISEEKEVSDYLNSRAPQSAVLYTNFNSPVFGYYTRLTTRVLMAQGDAFYRQFPQAMPADGYLVLYRELDKDPRMDWVEANAHFRRAVEFPSLIVYEYRARIEATPHGRF